MSKVHLTDAQWAFIGPLLPAPARTGRPRVDDRRTIEGIVYMLATSCRWQDLPREYGAPTTVWRRLKHWGEAGVWREHIWRAALTIADLISVRAHVQMPPEYQTFKQAPRIREAVAAQVGLFPSAGDDGD